MGVFLFWQETPRVRFWHSYLASMEPPLVQAGEWIDRHAPREARVLSGWGNVDYHSRRFVYDGTFLNRPAEQGSLLVKYAPEVRVDIWRRAPREYPIPANYRLVQVFRPPAGTMLKNHSVVVLFREDVPVSTAETSRGSPAAEHEDGEARRAPRELLR